jgi:uncharacterized protein
MKIQGTYLFEAPPAVVWQALFEPEVLAKTLPGCEKLEREGDQFKGEINVKMGPVQGKFQGKVDVTNVKPLDSYTMLVDGRGPAGFVKATAQLKIVGAGSGTRLEYDSDVQVGGRVASVGQRLLDASSRAIVKQSLEGLHEQIKALAARLDTVPASEVGLGLAPAPLATPEVNVSLEAKHEPAPAAAAPSAEWFRPKLTAPAAPTTSTASGAAARSSSQAAFALGVAKEVTKELFPVRTVLAVLGLLVLAWAIYRAARAG